MRRAHLPQSRCIGTIRHVLTIGKREGSFDGMLKERTFQFVIVSKNVPVGFSSNVPADRAVDVRGQRNPGK